MFLWGGVTVCTAAVNSYEGLYAQRFFLGFAEASVSPAFSLITVMCPSNPSSLCPLSAISGAIGSSFAPELLPSPPKQDIIR